MRVFHICPDAESDAKGKYDGLMGGIIGDGMAGKEHKLTINFTSTKGYPMRVMIDRSAAKVMKSGESYSVSLAEGTHEVMLSVSIRKKPVMK